MKYEKCNICEGRGKIPVVYDMAKLRQSAGLSQKEMATMLDITPSFLCDLEHGRRRFNPRMTALFIRICEGLNNNRKERTVKS